MPETKSVIEVVKRKNTISGSDQHIAMITGRQHVKKNHYYRHIETGQEYSHIAGGIGWPGEKPGFTAIVATEKDADTLHVLAEAEALNVNELLSECLKLRETYGYGRHPDLFPSWYGDHERFQTFVTDFNQEMERNEENFKWLSLSPPRDHERSNAFEIWVNAVRACLSRDTSGEKVLYLGNCQKLRNHIQNLPPDAAIKGSIEQYPAISCLGGLVHSLVIRKPWLDEIVGQGGRGTISTIQDDLAEYQYEHDRVIRDLWGDDDFGDMDEYDTGELKSTVDDKQ